MKAIAKKSGSLIEYLQESYPDSPRTRIKKMLHNRTVLVNDRVVTLHSFMLRPGDRIEIAKHIPESVDAPFTVLLEDNHVIVIDKPAGISTSSVDGSRNVQDSLTQYLKEKSKGKVRSFVVHRLDKEVSGVLLFAKSKEMMDILKDNWKETGKRYYALVEGLPEPPEGTIKSFLYEDDKQKVHSNSREGSGKLAITDYKVIRKEGLYSLLEITTHTGRKNQIRVHLSDIGCPIVGDRKYGASAEYIRRVRLHAHSLSFPHPETGETLTVESPMPRGFMAVKEEDEKYK